MIIDDDLLSREVLILLAEEAGFEVSALESGELALQALAHSCPDVVLSDMQMPGISGDPLARKLRAACPHATLLAMSGTPVASLQLSAFDHFMLKPFTMADLCAAAEDSVRNAAPEQPSAEVLSQSIYASLARSLSPQQLGQLYALSIDDADKRIGTMHQALAENDSDAYKRAAHAIKGGCGMVGAVELARLAGEMEQYGPQGVDFSVPPQQILEEFLAASQRLRRILDAQQR